jgi:hypothetical protein
MEIIGEDYVTMEGDCVTKLEHYVNIIQKCFIAYLIQLPCKLMCNYGEAIL